MGWSELGRIVVDDKSLESVAPLGALLRVTTTLCGGAFASL